MNLSSSTTAPDHLAYAGSAAKSIKDSRDRGPLTECQFEQFNEMGYLVLPGFLGQEFAEKLQAEVNMWEDEGWRQRSIECTLSPDTEGLPPVMELEMQAHGKVLAFPPLMEILEQLMGPAFAYHHMHSCRQVPDIPSKPWHHDYEQDPQVDRTYLMLHALHYLDGLDERTSQLVVLPGSHRVVQPKVAQVHLGDSTLEGEVVIDDLSLGSSVLLHSALLHARRRRTETVAKNRYLLDVSYCQAGTRWPPVKPFWRHMLQRGRELKLDSGRWPELFQEDHFTEYVAPIR